MLGQKEQLILDYLYQHRERFVTSKELAQYVGCSDRTIRTYVKATLEMLSGSKEGVTIISKQGYGYQLSYDSEATYLSLTSNDQFGSLRGSIDINDRHNYIINKLIFEQEKLLFDDLVDSLFVSRSTLSSDFKKIRQSLEKYHLKIESCAHKGVYVTGNEHDKRHFIMDYFFSGQFLKNIHNYIGDDFLKLPISFEELTIIVLDECRSGKLKLSDFVIQNLIVHIALTISRVKDGFQISELEIDYDKYAAELAVASNILNRVRYVSELEFPEAEVGYIALHLISESMQKENKLLHQRDHLRQDLLRATNQIDQQFGYQLSSDFTFIEGLLTHLEVLLERLSNDIHLDNPLLTDVLEQYKESFIIASSLVSHLDYFKNFSLSDDEVAYIALHILAAIERYRQNHKLNALVICATGYGSAQMLRLRLKNELSQQVNVVDLVGYYDITDDKLKDIDLIISTIDLSNLVFNIPIITTSVFLRDDEVKRIKTLLSSLRKKGVASSVENKENQIDVIFDQFFSSKVFKVYDTVDKPVLIRELVDLIQLEQSDDKTDKMIDLIKSREDMSTVIFDQDIAVPHPLKAMTKKPRIAVAVIKNGIRWEENYEKVRLVFLVSPSIYNNDGLSDITKKLVELTESQSKKEELIACDNFESFKNVFIRL